MIGGRGRTHTVAAERTVLSDTMIHRRCKLRQRYSAGISKPEIACGGMGKISDFFEAILEGKADAVSFAHVLHYNKINIADIRTQAKKFNLKLREYEIS